MYIVAGYFYIPNIAIGIFYIFSLNISSFIISAPVRNRTKQELIEEEKKH